MPYKNKHDIRYKQARMKWYYKNQAKHLAISNSITHKKKEYINKMKDKPCADCGQRFPYYVMDFDHRDKSVKKYTIGLMLHEGWGRICEEINKCDVVCSNCHRIRTYQNSQEMK